MKKQTRRRIKGLNSKFQSDFVYRKTLTESFYLLPLHPQSSTVYALRNMLRISSVMFVFEEYKNAFEWGKCQSYFTKPREKLPDLGFPSTEMLVRNEQPLQTLEARIFILGSNLVVIHFHGDSLFLPPSSYLILYPDSYCLPDKAEGCITRTFNLTLSRSNQKQCHQRLFVNFKVLQLFQHVSRLCLSFKRFIDAMCIPWFFHEKMFIPVGMSRWQ